MLKPEAIIVRHRQERGLEAVADLWQELIEHHRRLDERFWEPALVSGTPGSVAGTRG